MKSTEFFKINQFISQSEIYSVKNDLKYFEYIKEKMIFLLKEEVKSKGYKILSINFKSEKDFFGDGFLYSYVALCEKIIEFNYDEIISNLTDFDEIIVNNNEFIIIKMNLMNNNLLSEKWCIYNNKKTFDKYNKDSSQYICFDFKDDFAFGFNLDKSNIVTASFDYDNILIDLNDYKFMKYFKCINNKIFF